MAILKFEEVNFIRIIINIYNLAKNFNVNTSSLKDYKIITGQKQELEKLQKALQKQGLSPGNLITKKEIKNG